mmetsp:Transcript_48304/g.114866  ORF Transcript_48304/g.114866 Transcript_48304/m.114866 type:complete len:228 (-) Transcript_48304:952-1635(-)
MPLEVEVHPLAEAIATKQCLIHTDDLTTLPVDSGSVEVVNGGILLWADWVSHWTAVLGKLSCPHYSNILNSLRCPGAHVSGELLVAVDSQALLQCELEPVAASDPVTSPVVEVLVTNDTLDSLVISISGRTGLGKCERGVEDVQPLVLHGPHVEVTDGNDVVVVQIILKAKAILIPLHGTLQGLHSMTQLIHISLCGKHLQMHLATRGCCVTVGDGAEIPCHQSEKV